VGSPKSAKQSGFKHLSIFLCASIFYLYPSIFLPCKHKAIHQSCPVVPFMVSQSFSSIEGQVIKMARTVRQRPKS